MPVIPRYDGPQIQQQGLPDARQTTIQPVNINPVGELARGMGAVAEVFQKAQDDADKVRVFEARNQLQNAVNDSLYGENGVFNRKGKNAIGALGQWETDFDKVAQEYGKTLSPRQRRIYEQAVAEMRTPHRRQVLDYETGQLRAVEDATYDASAATSLNTIGLNWNNPEIIATNMDILDGAIIKKNQTLGTDAEVANLSRAEWKSKAHAQVATSALAAGNVGYAKEYFKQNRDNLLPQDRLKLEATINTESAKEEGLAGAQEAYAAAPQDMQAGMNQLRDKFKDNIQALEYAQSELKSMYAEGEVVRKQQQDRAFDTVMSAVADVRSRGRVPTLRDIPRDAYDALDPEKKFSLQTTLDALADRAARDAKERKNEADKARQQQLEAEASSLYWGLTFGGDLKNTNLAQYASVFMATDAGERKFADLVKTQKDLRNGNSEKLTQIQTDSAMVSGYLKQLKIDADSPEAIAAYDTFQSKLSAFEAQKGGKANAEEKRRMAQDMFIKREIVTPWFSGGSDVEKPAFMMDNDELSRLKGINNVPQSEREAIVADYKKATGKEPTDAQIVEIYRAAIQQAR